MLGWLAVAAAPVLVHLLSRRRYRQTDWAAMQFLLAAVRESRRRVRLEHLLLLLVRTLVIVLVVLAVADPHLQSSGFFVAPAGVRTHRVFVLDGSYSMAYTPAEASRFAEAKELIARIVRASPEGDGFSLVLAAAPPRVVVDTPALEPAEFVEQLEATMRTDTTIDLPATLEKVQSVLSRARRRRPGLRRQEVYFLTDLCRVGWMPRLGPSAAGAFLKRTKRLSQRARLVVIDLGQPGADNLAITRLQAGSSYVTLARPAELELTLHNFGRQTRENQTVELLVDAHHVARRTVDLPAGKSRSVRFSHRFDSPGGHTIEARLEKDRLLVDNHRWLVLPVRSALRVLCVDGRPGGDRGGACAYLAVALAPADGESPTAPVRPKVVPESALLELDLSQYDCLFLCNVAQFTSSEARVLGNYAGAGGGLVFFLGDRVLADRYNRELVERERLLPARLQGVVENIIPGLDPLDYTHPIVEPFRGQEKAGLITTPVDKYVRLAVASDTAARVVLAARSGDPLIVEQPVARGRVVLVATSADVSWTAMPLWPSYVPIVQEILAYATAGRIAQHNLSVGEPIDGTLLVATTDDEGRMLTPDRQEHALSVRSRRGRRVWSFESTDQSGVYTAQFGTIDPTEFRFGVNVDTIESDLDKLTEEQFREAVWPGVTFDYQTTWQESARPAPEPIARRGDLARWLLYGVLALLLAETFLGWRFGHHTT